MITNGFNTISFLITLTALASYVNYKYIKLPKSIGITFITLILSMCMIIATKFGIDFGYGVNFLNNIKFNETFLHGMLSFLLFAGSMHLNIIELSRYKVLIILLAIFSVGVSTVFIGYSLFFVSKLFFIELPFFYCFVFGALISPTDPIAVLGILKIVKVPRSLELKIAGEALFNDGMGIVLFFVTLSLAYDENTSLSFNIIIFYLIKQGFGGLLFGLVIGFLSAKLLKSVNDAEVAIIFTLGVVSGGYYLSHSVLEISGPICMVTAGLIIGDLIKRGDMMESTVIRLVSFWELLDEVLNAFLFVLIGLELIGIIFDFYIICFSILVIIITLIGRWISILIPVWSLSRFRSINFSLLNILTWCGLRGGVSIALSLSVDGYYHNFLVTVTYIVVIFSIMVQGLTANIVIRYFFPQGRK